MTRMTFDEIRKKFNGPIFGMAFATDGPVEDKKDLKDLKGGTKFILWSREMHIGFLDMVENRSQARTAEVSSYMGGTLSDGYYNTLVFSVKGKFAGIPGATHMIFVTAQRMKKRKEGYVVSDYTYPNKKTMGL